MPEEKFHTKKQPSYAREIGKKLLKSHVKRAVNKLRRV